MDNLLYKGKAIQCKLCGWCSTNKIGASNHISVQHREIKNGKDFIIRDVSIYYTFYPRDGTSISPFIGTNGENNDTYFIKDISDENNAVLSKEEILNITSTSTSTIDDNINNEVENTSTNQELTIIEDREDAMDTQNIDIDATIENNNPINYQQDENEVIVNPYPITQNDREVIATNEETKEFLSEEAIKLAKYWHNKYYNMQESIPKYKESNKKALREAMKNTIKNEIMPILYNIEKKEISEEDNPMEVINGCLCYCFHTITENTKKALGILSNGKRKTNKEKYSFEEIIQQKRNGTDAGRMIIKDISQIRQHREEGLEDGVLQNKEDTIINNILQLTNDLSKDMQKTIFGTNKITRKHVIDAVNNIINLNEETNIIQYIDHADNDIDNMVKKKKKYAIKKMRDLFRLSPKRAMKYYIDTHTSPNCPIDINEIKEELSARWQPVHFMKMEDSKEWEIVHKLKDEDKIYIINKMQQKETFLQVIKSRDITSAHGTDGIGYWALKLNPELGSEMMVSISKILCLFIICL